MDIEEEGVCRFNYASPGFVIKQWDFVKAWVANEKHAEPVRRAIEEWDERQYQREFLRTTAGPTIVDTVSRGRTIELKPSTGFSQPPIVVF